MRGSESGAVEPIEYHQPLVYDHEVATDKVGPGHPGEIQVVVVPHLHPVARRPLSADLIDPVSHRTRRKGVNTRG